MTVLPEADEIVPLLVRVGVGVLFAWLAAGKATEHEIAVESGLKVQETAAAVEPVRQETNQAYEEYHELVRYHIAQDAACDQALEMFSRHRDDDHDWEHVLEACHSETPAHSHATDDPSLPAEDPNQ